MNSLQSVSAIVGSSNVKQLHTLNSVLDVIATIKAMGGDLLENIVYNWRVRGDMQNEPIIFRMDSHILSSFLCVLSIRYKVSDDFDSSRPQYFSYTLQSKLQDTEKIEIKAWTVNKKIMQSHPCNFDIHLIYEDSLSMALRYLPYCMINLPDKITHLKERMCKQRFTTVDSTIAHNRSTRDNVQCIEEACALVDKAWCMDDDLLGNKTWIVAKWGPFSSRPSEYRAALSSQQLEPQMCPLCHENFNKDDIIINTKCNHNFHWLCDKKGFYGLRTWIGTQDKRICPCCRADLF